MHTPQCANKEDKLGHLPKVTQCQQDTGLPEGLQWLLRLKLCSIKVLARFLFRIVKGDPGINKRKEKDFEGKTLSGFFYDTLGFRYIESLSDQDQ